LSTLRERILAAVDEKEELVEVPEWDVTVLVKGLTGFERATFIKNCSDGKGGIDPIKGYPEIVILTAMDPETKEPIFQRTDRDELMKKSGQALERIAEVALNLAGLTQAAAERIRQDLAAAPNGEATSR
jgi:hypothetical protein